MKLFQDFFELLCTLKPIELFFGLFSLLSPLCLIIGIIYAFRKRTKKELYTFGILVLVTPLIQPLFSWIINLILMTIMGFMLAR